MRTGLGQGMRVQPAGFPARWAPGIPAPPCAHTARPAPRPAGAARSGVLVFNGVVTSNDGGGWQSAAVSAMQMQLQVVQEDIYMGRLTDGVKDLHEGAALCCTPGCCAALCCAALRGAAALLLA